MSKYRLQQTSAALLVVDVQERLCAAMEEAKLPRLYDRTRALILGARTLGLPIVYTEQYPKGLGPTVPALAAQLQGSVRVEKLSFSSAVPEVLGALEGRHQLLVAGMETHICVFQTVRDLCERGLAVHLCRDAVLSRTEEDRQAGLELCRQVGAVVTSAEAALFDLLGRAGTPEFKAISQAVK